MPRSKRAKVVHLSKVEKKGKDAKLKTFANIHAAVSKYAYLYVFSVENMRNTYIKDVRTQLSDSRLFFGKTKVMSKALGSNPADSPSPNTHLLSPYLKGSVGLLFSPRPPQEIQSFFASFHPLDYARAGTVATRSFTIPAGIIHSTAGEIPEEHDVPLAHSMEPNIRQLGPPTRLQKGKVLLEEEYLVCKEGEVLGSGQTTLLKMFGIAMAEFRVKVLAVWCAADGKVLELMPRDEMEVDGEGEDLDGGDEEEDDDEDEDDGGVELEDDDGENEG